MIILSVLIAINLLLFAAKTWAKNGLPKWYYGSVYQRIARCETGERWTWNSGAYQGAFGFWYGTWDAYKPRGYPREAYQATPVQQLRVAVIVAHRVGFGAWGCYKNVSWVRNGSW